MKAAGSRKVKGLASLTTRPWAEPHCLVGGESKRHPTSGQLPLGSGWVQSRRFPVRAPAGRRPWFALQHLNTTEADLCLCA